MCSQLGSRHRCANLRKTMVSYQLTVLQIQKTDKVNMPTWYAIGSIKWTPF